MSWHRNDIRITPGNDNKKRARSINFPAFFVVAETGCYSIFLDNLLIPIYLTNSTVFGTQFYSDFLEAIMTIAKQMDIRANIKKYFDMAFNGEPVIVPRKENKNVVIVSEKEFKEMEKAKNNAAYLAMLDKSDEQLRQGKVVVKTMEELEAMAAE